MFCKGTGSVDSTSANQYPHLYKNSYTARISEAGRSERFELAQIKFLEVSILLSHVPQTTFRQIPDAG